MSTIPYKLLRRRLLVVSALLVVFLLALQLATQKQRAARAAPEPFAPQEQPGRPAAQEPAGRPGQKPKPRPSPSPLAQQPQIKTPIPSPGKKQSEADDISENGPQFPPAHNMSSFSVRGFVKGRWPIVIDYELEAESTAEVTISTKDMKQPFVITLAPAQRKEVVSQLPEEFGQKPQVGVLSFQAFKNVSGQRKAARFFLYGLGVGDRAVGSVVIVQLQFQPGSIRPSVGEKASYSFRSLNDFNLAAADFMLVTLSADDSGVQRVYQETFKNGVRRGETIAREWDGKTDEGKISLGLHQFLVRVWRGLKSGGDWVAASTKQWVKVE